MADKVQPYLSVSVLCHLPYLCLASRFFARLLPIAGRHHWRSSVVQPAISQHEIEIEGASLGPGGVFMMVYEFKWATRNFQTN